MNCNRNSLPALSREENAAHPLIPACVLSIDTTCLQSDIRYRLDIISNDASILVKSVRPPLGTGSLVNRPQKPVALGTRLATIVGHDLNISLD
jgi:hypothetical protein